jgi:glutaredoxin
MFKYIRPVLGKILTTLDRMTSPQPMARAPEKQAQVDQQVKNLALYQIEGCPFCIKVRRAMRRMNLGIELRDVQFNQKLRDELVAGGGMYQAPCLKITKEDGSIQWMYESSDIIQYLETQFV